MQLLVGDVFRNAARAAPNRTAVAVRDHALAFGELDAASNRWGRALGHFGVGHGDVVATWADTGVDTCVLFASLAKLGAVFAPVNPRLGAPEAGPALDVLEPTLVVTDADRATAVPGIGVPGTLVATEAEIAERAATEPDDDIPRGPLREDDTHTVFLTSGSTGEHKGVVLSHRVNMLRSFQGALLEPRGPSVCMFPQFHMAGWLIALGCWQTRTACRFVSPPTAEALLDAVEADRAERLYAIPAVWRRMLSADRTGRDLSSLRIVDTGTSATPPDLLRKLEEAFPQAVRRVFYGSTEAGPCLMLADSEIVDHPGAVGYPQPLVETSVADDGELLVRGPLVFSEYLADPDATAAAFEDGWYRTGDTAAVDPSGAVSIVGRTHDVIRTGGESVWPGEVEDAVRAHPSVADCAVVGIADAEWGETVCAVVVARTGTVIDVEALDRHCLSRLAAYKRPRRYEVIEALPRTAATGQVQRALLAEFLADEARPG